MLSRLHLIPERHGQTDRIAISLSRVSMLTRDKNSSATYNIPCFIINSSNRRAARLYVSTFLFLTQRFNRYWRLHSSLTSLQVPRNIHYCDVHCYRAQKPFVTYLTTSELLPKHILINIKARIHITHKGKTSHMVSGTPERQMLGNPQTDFIPLL